MYYLLMYMYVFALLSLLLVRKHVFMCLLSLEFIVISLLVLMMHYIVLFNSGMYLTVVMMVFFVCEGVLGLGVLISLIRCYGNDYLSFMSLW